MAQCLMMGSRRIRNNENKLKCRWHSIICTCRVVWLHNIGQCSTNTYILILMVWNHPWFGSTDWLNKCTGDIKLSMVGRTWQICIYTGPSTYKVPLARVEYVTDLHPSMAKFNHPYNCHTPCIIVRVILLFDLTEISTSCHV